MRNIRTRAAALAAALALAFALTGCGSAASASSAAPQATDAPDRDTPAVEETAEETAEEADPPAQPVICYEEDYTGAPAENEFIADGGEYAVTAVITADADLAAFRLLALDVLDVADDGTLTCSSSELCALSTLSAGEAFAVTMNLPETVPLYAISYTEETGETVTLGIFMSGEDGSLFFDPVDAEPGEPKLTLADLAGTWTLDRWEIEGDSCTAEEEGITETLIISENGTVNYTRTEGGSTEITEGCDLIRTSSGDYSFFTGDLAVIFCTINDAGELEADCSVFYSDGTVGGSYRYYAAQ